MPHLEIAMRKYLCLLKRLAKSATLFHLNTRSAIYLYTRKRKVRWQCSDSYTPEDPQNRQEEIGAAQKS